MSASLFLPTSRPLWQGQNDLDYRCLRELTTGKCLDNNSVTPHQYLFTIFTIESLGREPIIFSHQNYTEDFVPAWGMENLPEQITGFSMFRESNGA